MKFKKAFNFFFLCIPLVKFLKKAKKFFVLAVGGFDLTFCISIVIEVTSPEKFSKNSNDSIHQMGDLLTFVLSLFQLATTKIAHLLK